MSTLARRPVPVYPPPDEETAASLHVKNGVLRRECERLSNQIEAERNLHHREYPFHAVGWLLLGALVAWGSLGLVSGWL